MGGSLWPLMITMIHTSTDWIGGVPNDESSMMKPIASAFGWPLTPLIKEKLPAPPLNMIAAFINEFGNWPLLQLRPLFNAVVLRSAAALNQLAE